MPQTNQDKQRRSSAFWWGLIIFLLAVASNFLYWLKIPQSMIPWINLVLPVIGVILLVLGLARIWSAAPLWGKILGTFVAVLAAGFLGISVWGFVHSREVPSSAGAPKVGQKAPEFTLADTGGHSISLSELLSTPMENSSRPRALLLVFYRGYW